MLAGVVYVLLDDDGDLGKVGGGFGGLEIWVVGGGLAGEYWGLHEGL